MYIIKPVNKCSEVKKDGFKLSLNIRSIIRQLEIKTVFSGNTEFYELLCLL